MKAFNGLEIKKSVGASEPLPAGGYVAKILNAKVEEYSWGEVLVISFDVAEGEYKDFFSKQYKENTREDKKWKGNFRLTVPNEGNQYFDSQKRAFGNAIWAIEESNPGYHWDWNEAALKGKSGLCNPRIYLLARQMSAFTWLCALCHLDLNFLCTC